MRSLIEEAARAELRDGGMLVNLGTPDQHKYTMGGWRTGWGNLGSDGTAYAEVDRSAKLTVHDGVGKVRAIKVRVRAHHPGQQVTLYVDETKVVARDVPSRWTTVDLPLEATPAPGNRTFTLAFAKRSPERPAARVDWVWLQTRDGPPPDPVKVQTLRFGSPRRALKTAPGRSYSYYLQIPPDTRLVFDYAGDAGMRFLVRVAEDGRPIRTLLALEAKPRWQEGSVDLRPLAGRVVRLDLVTRGTGKRGGWGEPDLVRSGGIRSPRPLTADNRPHNLIYVLFDTARRDVYRAFNSETRVSTPAMDRFAATATRYTRAYANSNWTKPSVATLWSGLYPSTHGAKTMADYLSREVGLLPEHLQRNRFTTAAFIANEFTSDKFGFRRGWDAFRNYFSEKLPTEAVHVYGDAVEWLRRHRARSPARRFFLWIQTIDPHVPYQAPKAFLERYYEGDYRGHLGPSVTGYETADFNRGKVTFSEDDRRYTRAQYDGEISYHDHHFGVFLDKLGELGLFENTLVVVSNDHGEELLDHGKYGHGQSLYEELIACPLLLRYPALFAPGAQSDTIVELVDLSPTLLQVLGVPPMPGMEGRSLMGTPPMPAYAISEFLQQARAVRVGRLKLIRQRNGREQLYDLRTDPAERRDLAASRPLARRAAEVYLGEGLGVQAKRARLTAMVRSKRFGGKRVVMDRQLRRQLEALGYIQ